jgi:hypothetical protein
LKHLILLLVQLGKVATGKVVPQPCMECLSDIQAQPQLAILLVRGRSGECPQRSQYREEGANNKSGLSRKISFPLLKKILHYPNCILGAIGIDYVRLEAVYNHLQGISVE